MTYRMTDNDARPVFLFGKIYQWAVNAAGNLSLKKTEITDADREEFGAEVDEFIKETQK